MKCKIIEKNHQYFNIVFDVKYLSYNTIAGTSRGLSDIIVARFEEVEFIYDLPWEEEVVKNREILKIKRPNEASYYMYFAIIKALEEHINERIEDMVMVKDGDYASKKVWGKKIKIAVNGKPVLVDITGRRYSNVFDIRITDLDRDEFLEDCAIEVEKLKIGLNNYAKRINGLMYTMNLIKNPRMYASTLELSEKGT